MKSQAILLSSLCLLAAVATWLTLVPSAEELARKAAEKADNDFLQRAKASPRLVVIFAEPNKIPPLSILTNLTTSDEPVLLSEYRSKTNMQERTAATWSLAYIGGDAALAAFRHTLTGEFAGRSLTGGPDREKTVEELFAINLVWAIGVTAQKNDNALNFLKQATDPWYWQKSVKWQSAFDADIYGILTSRAMQAIGMSGRKEVPRIFETLSKQPLSNDADPGPLRRSMNGSLVDAAFYYAMIQKDERDGFLEWFFAPKSDVFDADGEFARWSATDDGKKWHQWSDERDKINLIKQRERLKQAFPNSPP